MPSAADAGAAHSDDAVTPAPIRAGVAAANLSTSRREIDTTHRVRHIPQQTQESHRSQVRHIFDRKFDRGFNWQFNCEPPALRVRAGIGCAPRALRVHGGRRHAASTPPRSHTESQEYTPKVPTAIVVVTINFIKLASTEHSDEGACDGP
ncbi:hypothetical protein MSIM_40970 [Mycobacterium simiae]|nr:hypothetical protein MSIM_40970 [Mycobacterium simiae]